MRPCVGNDNFRKAIDERLRSREIDPAIVLGASGELSCVLLRGPLHEHALHAADHGAAHCPGVVLQRGLKPGDALWPEAAYNGEYIADIAADFLARKTVRADDREVTASGDIADLDGITRFAVAYLRHEQDLDLRAFGVRFDTYYLESSLYTDGRVERTVQQLVAAGKTYERDGALWLKSTDYGDDKDRVMRKSDGTYTYFVPDVAYHVTKWQRGFRKVINVQGTDHHSTVTRVRAGLQALGLGIPADYPDYVLHSLVKVVRGGQEVRIIGEPGAHLGAQRLRAGEGRAAVPGIEDRGLLGIRDRTGLEIPGHDALDGSVGAQELEAVLVAPADHEAPVRVAEQVGRGAEVVVQPVQPAWAEHPRLLPRAEVDRPHGLTAELALGHLVVQALLGRIRGLLEQLARERDHRVRALLAEDLDLGLAVGQM